MDVFSRIAIGLYLEPQTIHNLHSFECHPTCLTSGQLASPESSFLDNSQNHLYYFVCSEKQTTQCAKDVLGRMPLKDEEGSIRRAGYIIG